jgi:hypothetical protein
VFHRWLTVLTFAQLRPKVARFVSPPKWETSVPLNTGQKDTKEACAIEHRTVERHAILQRCLVKPPGASGPEDWRCITYNISNTGIGLTLPLPLPLGTILEIDAWGLPQALKLQARIVRTTPVEFLWFCGSEFFRRLSEAELRAWLAGPCDWLDKP